MEPARSPSSFSPIFEGSNSHGFLRSREGTFTTFDGAGAAFTLATSINPTGAITGSYFDASTVQHGFLRSDDGTFTTFNGPGSIFTFPASINPAGAITGSPTIGGDVIIMRRAPP
jgi:hypothetical protein